MPSVSPEHLRREPSTPVSSPPYPDAERETSATTDGLRPIASLSWADLCSEVIAAGIPEEGLSATSPWFNAQPSLDKRSAHVRLAERSIIDVIRAIAHKERRRSTRRSSEAITPKLTEDVLAKYLRNDASGRQYAQSRGSLHAVLLEYRYESLLETGDYTHTMRTIIDMLLGASRRVQRLAPVQDTLATHARGQPSDGTLKILLDEIDHMLLPNSDSDDFALMTLEWHPTNVGDGCVRTAAALATQLYNLASPLYTTPTDLDRTVLSYFRKAVMKARNLVGLRRDEAGLALPDKIYSTYCGRSNRATYVTAQQLIGELREPATIGTAVLRFEEEAPASRKRAADARAAAAARSVAALSLAPPLAAPAAAAFDNDLDSLYDVVEEDASDGVAIAAAAAGGAAGGAQGGQIEVPARKRGEYLDLDRAYAHADNITIVHSVGGSRRYAKLAEIERVPIFNPADPDGLYGSVDRGYCPVCRLVHPNATRSLSMAEFKQELGSWPTGRQGACPIPDDVVIAHSFDACRTLQRAVDDAAKRGKVPIDVCTPVLRDDRAARIAAERSRPATQG